MTFEVIFIITQVKHIVGSAFSCVSVTVLAFACLCIDGVHGQIVGLVFREIINARGSVQLHTGKEPQRGLDIP